VREPAPQQARAERPAPVQALQAPAAPIVVETAKAPAAAPAANGRALPKVQPSSCRWTNSRRSPRARACSGSTRRPVHAEAHRASPRRDRCRAEAGARAARTPALSMNSGRARRRPAGAGRNPPRPGCDVAALRAAAEPAQQRARSARRSATLANEKRRHSAPFFYACPSRHGKCRGISRIGSNDRQAHSLGRPRSGSAANRRSARLGNEGPSSRSASRSRRSAQSFADALIKVVRQQRASVPAQGPACP
jgi:hypothetical protein